MRWTRRFDDVGMDDTALVGGKNASLGQMRRALGPAGIRVPPGFAVTTEGYRHFIDSARLDVPIRELLGGLRRSDTDDVARRAARVRELILGAPLPPDLAKEIETGYRALSQAAREDFTDVAVRGSSIEDERSGKSFAGQQETFLNVRGTVSLQEAVRKVFASLYTPRALLAREEPAHEQANLALSVGIQKMVRADLASAGVVFTLDTESGHRGIVLVTSSYGLGEGVVHGQVSPDQFYVHKDMLAEGFRPLVWKKLGSKESRLVYDTTGHRQVKSIPVPLAERGTFSIDDEDVLALARIASVIEQHFTALRGVPTPMDIEWAKDGVTSELFVVQARPELVHSRKVTPTVRLYELTADHAPSIAQGIAVGDGVASGKARVLVDPRRMSELEPGEILVTDSTDSDWEPVLAIAGGLVTERGGRASHAALFARSLGIPAVLGASEATSKIASGQVVTLSCTEGDVGRVYPGVVPFRVEEIDPRDLDRPKTRILLNVVNPEKAFRHALLPSDGVGLAPLESIYRSWVGVHPLALLHYDELPTTLKREIDEKTRGYADRREYFVDRMAQGIGTVAAAFHPRQVLLRFSDFTSREYKELLGGARFEPDEQNPEIGFRGAIRYVDPRFRAAFLLEVAAVRRVRDVFGLQNLHVMVPFCRTPLEGERVLATLREAGLGRGDLGLEVHVMAALPSNVVLASDFAAHFDGFTLGANELTELFLGVDRESEAVNGAFDGKSPAVLWACGHLLERAHEAGRKVSVCGQAPSDLPELTEFLVERGIDAVSLDPGSLVRTTLRVLAIEKTRD